MLIKKNTGRSSHGKKKSNNIYMAELRTLESYLKMKTPQMSASPVWAEGINIFSRVSVVSRWSYSHSCSLNIFITQWRERWILTKILSQAQIFLSEAISDDIWKQRILLVSVVFHIALSMVTGWLPETPNTQHYCQINNQANIF